MDTISMMQAGNVCGGHLQAALRGVEAKAGVEATREEHIHSRETMERWTVGSSNDAMQVYLTSRKQTSLKTIPWPLEVPDSESPPTDPEEDSERLLEHYVVANVTQWLSKVPPTEKTAQVVELLTSSLQPAVGQAADQAPLLQYAAVVKEKVQAAFDPAKLKHNGSFVLINGAVCKHRVAKCFIEVWPTVSNVSERMVDWASVGGANANSATASVLTLMVAIEVFDNVVSNILQDSFLEHSIPKSSVPPGHQEGIEARRPVVEAAVRFGQHDKVTDGELRYIAGWVVATGQRKAFKATIAEQEVTFPTESGQTTELTVDQQYQIMWQWMDTSTGAMLPQTNHLAPGQRLVKPQESVVQFLKRLECVIQLQCFTPARLAKYGANLVVNTMEMLSKYSYIRKQWAQVQIAANIQLHAISREASVRVLQRFVTIYMKSRQKTVRLAWSMVPEACMTSATRSSVLMTTSTTLHAAENLVGLKHGTLEAFTNGLLVIPSAIINALGLTQVEMSKVAQANAATGKPKLIGQYSVVLQDRNHGIVFNAIAAPAGGSPVKSACVIAHVGQNNSAAGCVNDSNHGIREGDTVVYAQHNGREVSPGKLVSNDSVKYPLLLVVLDKSAVLLQGLRTHIEKVASDQVLREAEQRAAEIVDRKARLEAARTAVVEKEALQLHKRNERLAAEQKKRDHAACVAATPKRGTHDEESHESHDSAQKRHRGGDDSHDTDEGL
jgi:hypothetical protein